MDGTERDGIARRLAEVACAAGEILRYHQARGCSHSLKADGSPASVADVEAEAQILASLAESFPDIPAIAEETCHDRPPAARFFLVDPLDGTREFLAGTPEYAVCIGLVAGTRPIAAALAAPGLGRIWYAGAVAFEAEIASGRPGAPRPVRARAAPESGLVALGSRRHGDPETEACLAALPVASQRGVGSAVKFGLVASGEADLYVRCGPTMEWDTAAGDHLVTVAGGCVVTPGGGPLAYGRHAAGYRNGAFAALGDPRLAGSVVQRIAPGLREAAR
ncbi:3'(2'),5'-bisphosphate nucleotidase CysQ family protein [Methylobacterium radiodurans]|uniref:3'(2'),5'-bisphosphate nucleotidase CysQ n=1 Tax=Methylobacterium radiodurans TaxID=2202828 RepID=A0A2U8VM77_9HYPH|nr:3'(2'),5'-bisphosphate nucleotidase CysQ [Methylobacterium radiodurans]AWN34531.1 3'(2'),5'-bisphosphate nucleotidase CysQ [Methylobacterium radiodurans]